MKKLDPHVFGSTFVNHLSKPFLVIGSHRYSRRDLVEELGTGNFTAAARLGRVLKKLHISSPAKLNDLTPESLASVVGVGVATLYVAMCVLEAEGYSVARWYGWRKHEGVTFETHKRRAFLRSTRRKHAA